jgi:HEAT repeat protein
MLRALLGCGIALVLLLTLLHDREPRYKGHSLSQWLALLEGEYASDPELSLRDAEEAIDHFGTNALPYLIRWVQHEEKPWRTRLSSLSDKLPAQFAFHLNHWVVGHTLECQLGAFIALDRLGTNARPAIPTLVAQLKSQPLWIGQSLPVLAHFGGDALAPVHAVLTNPSLPCRIFAISAINSVYSTNRLDPSLLPTLTHCLQDTNRVVAFGAAQILCAHHTQKELAIKTFTDALESADKNVRRDAFEWLKISLRHGYSVPELLQLLQDTNSPVSPYAAAALGEFLDRARSPETVLAALTNSLHDPRPLVRSYAANSIGHFREAAEPAAPALLNLWNDPDMTVRLSATNAFYKLPSYVGLRDPVPYYSRQFTNLLHHPDIRIRQMATNAFQKLSDSNVVNQSSEDAVRE